MSNFVKLNFTFERKSRSDKDASVFDSEEVRKRTFTPFNTFKKKKYSEEWRETTEKIPHDLLLDEFNNLSQQEKDAYKILADRDMRRSRHLWDEVKEVLLKTKGKISFSEIANQLGNIVCLNTIRKYLMKRDGLDLKKRQNFTLS